MALQIGPFKASRRQILPGLNISKYEQTATRNGRIYYKQRKGLTKSEQRTRVLSPQGKLRISLETPGLARRTARQRLGSAIAKENYGTWINKPSKSSGTALKQGILGMTVKAGITDQSLYNKLAAMDPSKLQYLYDSDKLIFDVAFSYDPSGDVGANKMNDLKFLVESYEKAFGAMA